MPIPVKEYAEKWMTRDNGIPMATPQRIAGHTDITITARHYLKVDAGKQHENVTKA